MKRVIIAHGWDGTPEEGWFPWIKGELEQKGFQVIIPQLPDPATPRMEAWVPTLAAAVGTPDHETYFVGHSMGCQTIARYLEKLDGGIIVGGTVFVAGFFKRLLDLGGPEENALWESWRAVPIDLAQVKARSPKSIAIFSDNDPWVPLDNQDDFRDQLGSKIVIEHAAGHFSGDTDHCVELPIALESVLTLASE